VCVFSSHVLATVPLVKPGQGLGFGRTDTEFLDKLRTYVHAAVDNITAPPSGVVFLYISTAVWEGHVFVLPRL